MEALRTSMKGEGDGVLVTALGTKTAGMCAGVDSMGTGSFGVASRAAALATVESMGGWEQALTEAAPLLSVAGEADAGA